MKINVEVVDEKINNLSVQVFDNRLEVQVTNKNTAHEVIFLIAALLGQNSTQNLKIADSEHNVLVTCEGIDLSKIDEVVLKVESRVDFSNFGLNEILDMYNSYFSFEPMQSTKD